MLAPRRIPPCLMFSVAQSKPFMKDTGPGVCRGGGAAAAPLGAKPKKENAVPPAGPLHQGHQLHGFEDVLQCIFDGKHETGAQLASRPSRVCQSRAVGKEVEGAQQLIELGLPFFGLAAVTGKELGIRNRLGDTPEELVRRFPLALTVRAPEVAALQDMQRVGRKPSRAHGLVASMNGHPEPCQRNWYGTCLPVK